LQTVRCFPGTCSHHVYGCRSGEFLGNRRWGNIVTEILASIYLWRLSVRKKIMGKLSRNISCADRCWNSISKS
jgi:hypothetical protein